MGDITQRILTQNKFSTYLFMHLYIQPIGHLIILKKKKITLLDLAIVKTIPKFPLTQASSVQRHTDLKTFMGLEELLEFETALHSNFFFFFFALSTLLHVKFTKNRHKTRKKTDDKKTTKSNHNRS